VFRVTIRGTFDGLSVTDRAALRTGADAFVTAFTEAGTFTSDSSLSV
jgi:hypothetical protein